MLITPELKDKILEKLVSNESVRFYIDIYELSKEFDIEVDAAGVILDHFETLDFLSLKKFSGGKIRIIIGVPAHDFYSHGGFVGQEELLVKNIQKLLLEIESLKPSMPDRIKLITTLAANIFTGLGFFIKS